MFTKGGPTMYLIAMVALPMLIFCILHLIMAQGWSLAVAIVLLVAPLSLGIFGTLHGRRTTDIAVAHVATEQRAELREVGYKEARHPLNLGVAVTVIGIIPMAIGEVRRFRRR
jgi:hypothetical protein